MRYAVVFDKQTDKWAVLDSFVSDGPIGRYSSVDSALDLIEQHERAQLLEEPSPISR